MTKVSKVYFGLSRVSSAGGRWARVARRGRASRRASGRRGGADGGSDGGALSTCRSCRLVDSSMCSVRLGRSRSSSAGLTVTAIRISRPKADGERVLELAAQPALELAAGEVVGHGDDRGALVQGDRLAGAQPGPLVGLELVDAPRARRRARSVAVGRRPRGSVAVSSAGCLVRCAVGAGAADARSTALSTGCAPGPRLVERACAETHRGTGSNDCLRRSEALFDGAVAWVTRRLRIGSVRGWRGTSVAANVTSARAPRARRSSTGCRTRGRSAVV